MDPRQAYATLGLSAGAPWDGVRQAYRAELRRVHPDTSRGRGDPRALERARAAYRELRALHQSSAPTTPAAGNDPSDGRLVDLYA
jgi:DnaJ-class molecular chaperone